MKRILLVQPSLQPPGGGNGVAAWMIEALKHEHAVSVLTWHPLDLAPINHYYGTALKPSEFGHAIVPAVTRVGLDLVPVPLSLLKTSLLLRQAKRLRHAFDVVITANNEADFGCRGIQYVHFPWAYQPRPPVDLRWYHCSSAAVDAYYRLCVRVAGFSFERMRHNLTLVNSRWTGAKVRERHGIDSIVLYPPVAGEFLDVPWPHRSDGFVCIGRISPEKELDKIIDILAMVRARGRQVHLHIIGSPDNPRYYEHIRRRARAHAAWISLHDNLSRAELMRLVSQHRYGMHGMSEEHFGMAVAEMVQGGCLPFVPRGGGQTEIIGDEPRLLYETPEDAAAKIMHVLSDTGVQQALRAHLAARRELFSTEVFVHSIRGIVQRFV